MLLAEVKGRNKCSGQVGLGGARTRGESSLDTNPWGLGALQNPAHRGPSQDFLGLSPRNTHFSSAPRYQSLELDVPEPKNATPHIPSEAGGSILPSGGGDPGGHTATGKNV